MRSLMRSDNFPLHHSELLITRLGQLFVVSPPLISLNFSHGAVQNVLTLERGGSTQKSARKGTRGRGFFKECTLAHIIFIRYLLGSIRNKNNRRIKIVNAI